MMIEGVSYLVNWRKLLKGCSFFIPCINHRAARREINQVAARLKLDLVTKLVIEDGVKGLRVWRT
jgi:hypothetical protein